MKNYYLFKVFSKPYQPELISGLLWELPIDGITEEEDHLNVYASENSNISLNDLELILDNLMKEKFIDSFNIVSEVVENQNWNEEWEKRTPIIEISDKIVIKPSFKNLESTFENKIILEIDPKMSFGTGEHETTKLMLRALEKYIKPESKILDIGTGTGILAIAAAKLENSQFILGIDNDEWCFINGNENVKLNSVADRVEIRKGEIGDIPENNFDLIMANINKPVLLQFASIIVQILSINGMLLLSGILRQDEPELINHYKKFHLQKLESMHLDEWSALVFKK